MLGEFWEVLGIAPSTNQEFITRVYRQKRQVVAASIDAPHTVRQVDAAYEAALHYAKKYGKPKKNSIKRNAVKKNHSASLDARNKNVATTTNRPSQSPTRRRNAQAQQRLAPIPQTVGNHTIGHETTTTKKRNASKSQLAGGKKRQQIPYGEAPGTFQHTNDKINGPKKGAGPRKTTTRKKSTGAWLLVLTIAMIVKSWPAISNFITEQVADISWGEEVVNLFDNGQAQEADPDHSAWKEKDDLTARFIYYFYLEPQDADKEQFMTENCSAAVENSVGEIAAPVTFNVEERDALTSQLITTANGRTIEAWWTADTTSEPFIIFVLEDNKIAGVFAPDWLDTDGATFAKLVTQFD